MEIMNRLPRNVSTALNDAIPKMKMVLPIKRVILFGSYSCGTYTSQSDVDVAVFLEDGCAPLKDAYKAVSRIFGGYGLDFQPQVFYESESDSPIGILEEIFEHGIDITDLSIIK